MADRTQVVCKHLDVWVCAPAATFWPLLSNSWTSRVLTRPLAPVHTFAAFNKTANDDVCIWVRCILCAEGKAQDAYKKQGQRSRLDITISFTSPRGPPATNTSPLPPPNTLAFANSGLVPIVCVASTRTAPRAFLCCLGCAAGSAPPLKQLRACMGLPSAMNTLVGRPALTERPGAAITVLAMLRSPDLREQNAGVHLLITFGSAMHLVYQSVTSNCTLRKVKRLAALSWELLGSLKRFCRDACMHCCAANALLRAARCCSSHLA